MVSHEELASCRAPGLGFCSSASTHPYRFTLKRHHGAAFSIQVSRLGPVSSRPQDRVLSARAAGQAAGVFPFDQVAVQLSKSRTVGQGMWRGFSMMALLAGILCLSSACSGGESAAEARALLSAIAELDADSNFSSRAGQLARLTRLQLRDTAVASTRDVCLRAHLSLLEAERNQSRALSLLTQAADARAEASPTLALMAQQEASNKVNALAQRVRQLVKTAEGNVAEGTRALSRCKAQARTLTKRLVTGM